MIPLGTVSEIWRYPAKSMGGETLPSAHISVADGVAGDRRWAVRDEELGEIVNGRRIPRILMLDARFTGRADASGEQQAEIGLPSGERILSDDPYVHAALSAYLGRRVSLQRVRPAAETPYYKYGHLVTAKDLRRILGRPPHEPLADPSRLRLPDLLEVLRFSVQRGTHFDLSRLHIVTTASLRRFQEMLPDSQVDVRRFRPNLVIDTVPSIEPFAEHGWSGWRLQIGEVEIAINSPAIRCTMPGQAQPGLAADQQVQIALRRELNEDFGVYADPLTAGEVRAGDRAVLVPPRNRLRHRLGRAANTAAIKAIGLPNLLVDRIEQRQARKPAKAGKPPREFRPMRVEAKETAGGGATSIVLVPESPLPWAEFLPGQHLLLRLEIPGALRPVYRSYSISSPPTETGRYRITVKPEGPPGDRPNLPPGLGSDFLVHRLQVGERLLARGPLGGFHLMPGGERPLAFLSMGIGLTPLLSMARAIAQANPQRELWWFHGVRNDEEFPLGAELAALAGSMPNLHLNVQHSRPTGSGSKGGGGRLEFPQVRTALPHLDLHFYLCGKPEFMAAMHAGLRKSGVDSGHIRYEFFSQGRSLEAPPAAAAENGDRPRVRFARSGRELPWEPGTVSLLELAERNGISIESGCRYGNCHACKVRLLEGDVERQPLADPPPEPGVILACSTTPLGDVTLDA